MSYRTSEDHAQEIGRFRRWVAGMLRRMEFTIVDGRFFQLLGQRDGTGGPEVVRAEPFSGFGIFAVPPTSGDPVVIMAGVGGSGDPVVVAALDEPTRAAAVADVGDDPGTVVVYNDKALIVITPSGGVEIRLLGGVALALPTMADFNALRSWVEGHVHTYNPGPLAAALTTPPSSFIGVPDATPTPVGTSVLKTQ